jgi:hypothetical protein
MAFCAGSVTFYRSSKLPQLRLVATVVSRESPLGPFDRLEQSAPVLPEVGVLTDPAGLPKLAEVAYGSGIRECLFNAQFYGRPY